MAVNWNRRRVLGSALATGGDLLIPHRYAVAQDKAAALLRTPKQALVIGNGKYRHELLKNSTKDARAIADALKSIGFETVVGIDWTRTEMENAIRGFAEQLTRQRAIGLFYFAGHGAQLDWRNYAVPADAEVATLGELTARCIEINTVVDGMRRAGNPLNVVILDACRDNPFGKQVRPEQRGLSQTDAPPGMLMAYATAPGNTAIDADGSYDLYTEHLLREITVPEVKVEDVFKRVRMGVRRRSSGQQVPWESTSLDDDFWFVPPQVLKKRAEETEREFKEERAAWERAHTANAPGAVETYLRRYPSGRFSELAQARLDRILASHGEKKIAVVSSPQNPFSKGSMRPDTAYRVGDKFTYRYIDTLTRLLERESTLTVTQIMDDEVVFDMGGTVTDSLGNYRKLGGEIWTDCQIVPTEFSIGKRWSTRFPFTDRFGEGLVSLDLRVVDREQISVPAGSFNAFRVEAHGWLTSSPKNNVAWNWTFWYAPDVVRRFVAWERMNRNFWRYTKTSRLELTAFKQA